MNDSNWPDAGNVAAIVNWPEVPVAVTASPVTGMTAPVHAPVAFEFPPAFEMEIVVIYYLAALSSASFAFFAASSNAGGVANPP